MTSVLLYLMAKTKPLEPLIPLDDLKKVVKGLVAVPKPKPRKQRKTKRD